MHVATTAAPKGPSLLHPGLRPALRGPMKTLRLSPCYAKTPGAGGGKKGKAQPLSAAEPLQPEPAAPQDVAQAAQQVAKAAGKLADTALAAAEEVASTAVSQGQLVNDELQATQKEVVFTAEQLAEGVQSDASDVAAAVQQTAEGVESDAADVAAAVQQTAAALGSDALAAAGGVAGAAAGAVAAAAAAPAPAGSGQQAEPAPAPPAGGSEAGAPPQHDHSGVTPNNHSVSKLKLRLVEVLASLDRGVAATKEQQRVVSDLCTELQAAGGPVSLSWDKIDDKKATLALLDGRWRLLYSSGFASGSQGGLRPGPSFSASPFRLGQVYQDISVERSELDNVVDLVPKFTLAGLPGLQAETPVACARLKHSMQVVGSNTIEITFDATTVTFRGGLRGWLDGLPTLNIPGLQQVVGLPKRVRSARFDVVYLDGDLRITKGDRGELRVFVKGGI